MSETTPDERPRHEVLKERGSERGVSEINPEARRVRARLRAIRHARHLGGDIDALTEHYCAELERTGFDAHVDDFVATAPRMTPAQADRIADAWWTPPSRPAPGLRPPEAGCSQASP